VEKYVRSLSFMDPQHRSFGRTLFEWANDAELDSQSRISISQDLTCV
jgi:DNA-binding transcriptional regulator/RsmH inhibitor MraZ